MYRDFSHIQSNVSDDRSKRKTFPTLLHEFVSDPQNNHIITWLPHGRSFIILNREQIESECTQTYFKLTKIKSFIRQLNRWGFHRVTKGLEKGSYYHELFLRGMPHLTYNLKRPKGFKKEETIEEPPNFEDISKENPLPATNHRPNITQSLTEADDSSNLSDDLSASLNPIGLLALQLQMADPLFNYLQRDAYLKQLLLRRQLILPSVHIPPLGIDNRTHNAIERALFLHLLSQTRSNPYC